MPEVLLERYPPRCAVDLFSTTYFLSRYLYDEALGFMVGYLVQESGDRALPTEIFPRIFYKDSSLMWRVASHYVHDEEEYWIGKGDVREYRVGDHEYIASLEETTNLPLEVQSAFDTASRAEEREWDDDAIDLVLRRAPSGRIRPYEDFLRPRRLRGGAVNGGQSVAWFEVPGNPESLRFAEGYAPDLDGGVVAESRSESSFFGGEMRKVRVVSENREIQYLFFASPTHAWLNPPQALTRELSTFGVRLVDVHADDDLTVPGYEYHEPGEDGPSQIPSGFAGAPHPEDPHRSDASAWLDALPVIQEFRAKVLDARARRSRRRA